MESKREYQAQYYQKNKEKLDKRNREWQRTHKKEVRHYDYKRRYGLSYDEAKALGTSCSICGKTEDLCIDHNHQTGKVRGVLCRSCNLGLGKFQDSIKILESAMAYLNKET